MSENIESLDVKTARKEAEKEIRDERLKEAKGKLKSKLQALADARLIVSNLERELNELEHELAEGI